VLTQLGTEAQSCPPTWVFVSPTNNFNNFNAYYEASQHIEASNQVTGASNITYDAGVYVKLKPGFEAKTNLYFKAWIDGCRMVVGTSEEEQQKRNIRISPNPTSGFFVVELPLYANASMIFRIMSLAGQVLLEENIEAGSLRQEVNVHELPAGLYFLQVFLEGNIVWGEKFVKQ